MMGELSNRDMAKIYDKKQRLVGELLRYELLEDDRVLLIDVLDKENSGRLVIPRFITDIRYRESPFYDESGSALKGCKYREVYIDNSGARWFNSRWICSGMESESIKIEFKNPNMVIDMRNMFNECSLLKEVDISKLDTRNVGNMERMFSWCKSLIRIDMGNLDMSKVESMAWMFNGCINLREVNIGKMDTGMVEDMQGMFYGCASLRGGIDLSGVDMSGVVTMERMFSGCMLLRDIDFSNLDIQCSNGGGIYDMFSRCDNIKEIKLAGVSYKKLVDIFSNIWKEIVKGSKRVSDDDTCIIKIDKGIDGVGVLSKLRSSCTYYGDIYIYIEYV